MTNDMMTLRALMEKSPDADDISREMIGYGAQRLMEPEVGGLTGAAHGEKSPARPGQRNGYRDREWETRAGTVERCTSGTFARKASSAPSSARGAASCSSRSPGGWQKRR